jgi:large subunit ribosomal protein L18
LGEEARERFSASDVELLKDLPSHFEEVLERIRSG